MVYLEIQHLIATMLNLLCMIGFHSLEDVKYPFGLIHKTCARCGETPFRYRNI